MASAVIDVALQEIEVLMRNGPTSTSVLSFPISETAITLCLFFHSLVSWARFMASS